MDIEQLVIDIVEGRTSIDDLDGDDLDAVILAMYEVGLNMIDTDQDDIANQILDIVEPLVESIMAKIDQSGFEEAIQAAEARGSTYWEVEDPTLQ